MVLLVSFFPFLLGGVLALSIGFMVLMGRKHLAHLNRMKAEMIAFANDLGFKFFEKDTFGLANQLQEFDLFVRERKRFGGGKITNIISGQVEGTDVHLFEYTYVVNTGKSVVTIRQTVFFANDKTWSLPKFKIRPETWWHKVLAAIGVKKDINFQENPDFSTRFWLTGKIEEMIRGKFGPELQQFFCERPPAHLEGSNYYLIAYKPNKVLNPDEARLFFEHCCQLVSLMKKQGNDEVLSYAELRQASETLELQNEKLIANS